MLFTAPKRVAKSVSAARTQALAPEIAVAAAEAATAAVNKRNYICVCESGVLWAPLLRVKFQFAGESTITHNVVIPTKAKPRGGIFAPIICLAETVMRRSLDSHSKSKV